jgi:hypothetical protein
MTIFGIMGLTLGSLIFLQVDWLYRKRPLVLAQRKRKVKSRNPFSSRKRVSRFGDKKYYLWDS